jgi:hypothetical protein
MVPEFGHDCIHRALVFFEEQTELFVFIQEGLVFDDYFCVRSFELRLESFYLMRIGIGSKIKALD